MKKKLIIDLKIESMFGEEKEVLKQLDCQLARSPFLQEDCEEFKVALAEICINAIEHGNQENKQKYVHVIVTLAGDLIEGIVMDEGKGFVYADAERENDERGWGLKIVDQFVDHWTMYQLLDNPHSKFCIQLQKHLQ